MKEPRVRKAPRARVADPAPAHVPGGKALARLHLFEQERELPETDVRRATPLESFTVPMPTAARADGGLAVEIPRNGEVSPYLAAFQQMLEVPADTVPTPIPEGWRPLGPFAVPHGQTYGSGPGSRPPVAGRMAVIATDPGNSNHILVGAAGGGVWETKDGGSTWDPRTDNQPALATGAIAFNPSNPSIVYAGTGEGNFFARLGVGLLRSTNGGTTWSLIATAPFSGLGFYDLIVDPLNGNHLLAATSGGLFESTNGGTSWTQRRAQKTWDLSMHPPVMGDPNSTKEVFAACADGVFRSTDGGTTWAAVSLPGAPSSFMRIAVCHAPSNGNVVYVFAANVPPANAQPTPFLWRRAVFGGPFTAATTPPGLGTGQAWYDWFAAVAPNNPDVLYVAGIDVHKGVRSPANTWTWTNISAKTVGDSIHPDQHAIAFSPTDPNVVYVGNDGGIYRSPNGGTNWKSLDKGLCITELEYIAQHSQFEAWLLGGTQDNGTLRYEGEEVWYHVQDGDGGDCGANAASPYTCYHTFFGMGMQRSTSGGGWGSWASIGPVPPANHSALFYPPVEVNNNVVAQAGSTVFISTDTGTTWTPVPLPSGAGVASALAIPSATVVYAGTNNGRVYRINSVANVWQAPVQLTQPRVGFISDILVDPTNPNRIWVTYSSLTGGHVYRSDNGGAAWTDVSAGLPNIPANAIVVDPTNTNVVYVAMDVGVYRSTNAGASWASFSNLLPNALVKDLVFHQPSRLLRAATQSRGVWQIAVDPASMPNVEVYLRDSVVDTGRTFPSLSGVNDPFHQGSLAFWWQCTDIKVDSPSYQKPNLSDVDFELFEDDHGVFAAGLIDENPQRGKIVRVFVEVHNRGLLATTNVAVKCFFADASLGLPNLPAGFWTNFPNNVLPAASPWKPIAPHKIIPKVDGGRAQIVGFEWNVPTTAATHTCLLAVISAANDSITASQLQIAPLARNEKKCGLKNLHVVNPPPSIGPITKSVLLNLWGSAETEVYSLGLDRTPTGMVRGMVLSKRLAEHAKQSNLKRVELNEDDHAELGRHVKEFPHLKDQLDASGAFLGGRGVWLKSFKLDSQTPEPVVALLEPKPRPGQWSLVQYDANGEAVGGFTFEAMEPLD